MTAPLPPVVKALQASLRRAREPALRERLSEAVRKVRRLYDLPIGEKEETGDLRRGGRGIRPSQMRKTPPDAASIYRREWRARLAREEGL
jgi:hypothetical protein